MHNLLTREEAGLTKSHNRHLIIVCKSLWCLFPVFFHYPGSSSFWTSSNLRSNIKVWLKNNKISSLISLAWFAAIARTVGHLNKSAEVMKLVNNLMKAPEIAVTMQNFSKEMIKVSLLKEFRNKSYQRYFNCEDGAFFALHLIEMQTCSSFYCEFP